VKETFVDVALKLPVDREFRYRVPPELAGRIALGSRVRVPFRNRSTTGFCVGFADRSDLPKVRDVLDVLDETPLLSDVLLGLARWMARRYLCSLGEALTAVLPPSVRGHRSSRTERWIEAASPPSRLEEACDRLRSSRPAQAEILRLLLDEPLGCEATELRRRVGCSPSPLRTLESAGLVRTVERPRSSRPLSGTAYREESPVPVLDRNQEAALAPIVATIRGGESRVFLLHGVTGSGKTEVYLRAIGEVVRRGRQAIVLVPEISLTPQTVARFQARLERIAVLHSHLTDAERLDQWRRIREGEADVVIGARSAVFAPTPDLGILVLDEEHETSFKQQSAPRYHARDTAVARARLQGIPVILGSATPSLESFRRAQDGEYTLLRLPNRVDGRPLPPVEIYDMTGERWIGGKPPLLGRRLRHLVQAAIERGEQVLLYLNRRGHSTYLTCHRCGHVVKCARCDITLTFHRGRQRAVCHYCSFETEPPVRCPACEGPGIRYLGAGTEKIEEEVQRLFPGCAVARLDSDTARQRGSIESTMERFRSGEIQILVGTQMIAKGLDFPNVTVVGIVSADISLHLPDFRSAERTFQQVAQVAGRTGRGSKGGLVVVQTTQPDHPAIRHSSRHDFEGFARHELPFRESLGYPPFRRLLRVLASGRQEERVRRIAGDVAAELRGVVPPDRLLGPCPAPIPFVDRRYRYHLLVKGGDDAPFERLQATIRGVAERLRDVSVVVDVDPVDTL
jgi:primosomal protein N' (replication factor Y)